MADAAQNVANTAKAAKVATGILRTFFEPPAPRNTCAERCGRPWQTDVEMMRLFALSSVVLFGLVDPTCVNPLEDGAPGETKTEAASAEDCMAACADGKSLSDTDRQTCRLLCDKDVEDPGPAGKLTARFELCQSRCEPQAKTDAATCALNCEQASLSSLGVSDEVRTCLTPCLTAWQACEGACEGESKTDAATCRLQCDQAAKSCGDACVK